MSVWYCDLRQAAPDSIDERGGGFRVEHRAVKHPRTVGQRMLRLEFAALDRQAQGSRTDTELPRGFRQIHPAL
jgi:hypothetical protein